LPGDECVDLVLGFSLYAHGVTAVRHDELKGAPAGDEACPDDGIDVEKPIERSRAGRLVKSEGDGQGIGSEEEREEDVETTPVTRRASLHGMIMEVDVLDSREKDRYARGRRWRQEVVEMDVDLDRSVESERLGLLREPRAGCLCESLFHQLSLVVERERLGRLLTGAKKTSS
jgi:hypothetical protein